MERGYGSCAECAEFSDLRKCRRFNNLPGKVIGFLTGSDRFACIARIRETGMVGYAAEMDAKGMQSVKKRGNKTNGN